MSDSDTHNEPHKPGPRTEQGKARSRLNSFKHGITAQVINMPPEMTADYLSFNKAMVQDWQPKGFMETQIAQTIGDCQWRLNAGRAWQMNLFAEHYDRCEGQIETDRPEVEAAFLDIQVVEKKSNVLKTISLYETRINRILQTAIKQLQDMQKARREREEKEMFQAAQILKVNKMKGEAYNPSDDGFVFSTKQFEQFLTLQKHQEEVRIAKIVHYDLKKFTAAAQNTAEPSAQ